LFQTEDGVIIDLDGIERREGEFEVYNFEVEDFHTYFVSDLEILVHNACGSNNEPPQPPITDDMWGDIEEFNNPPSSIGKGDRDSVNDAVQHIIDDHPERLGELGLGGAEDLGNLLDDLMNNGQRWLRKDNNSVAYVDPQKKIIFIDNPTKPTIFQRDDYENYLRRDKFTPI
jgi:hypothetical protein